MSRDVPTGKRKYLQEKTVPLFSETIIPDMYGIDSSKVSPFNKNDFLFILDLQFLIKPGGKLSSCKRKSAAYNNRNFMRKNWSASSTRPQLSDQGGGRRQSRCHQSIGRMSWQSALIGSPHLPDLDYDVIRIVSHASINCTFLPPYSHPRSP